MQLPKFEIERFSFVPDISTRLYFYFADFVEKHPFGAEVITQLEADDRVASLQGKMISFGNGGIRFDIKRLAMWFLWRVNESGLESAKKSLEVFLAHQNIAVLNTLWVLGVSVEDPIELVEGYRILPIEQMPESQDKEQFLTTKPSRVDLGASRATAAIIKNNSIPKIYSSQLEALDPNSEFRQCTSRLFDIALLINALPNVSCTPYLSTAYPCDAPFGPFEGSGGGIYSPDVPPQNHTIFTLELASQLSNLIEAFSQKPLQEQRRLHRILHRIAQAKRRLQIEDKILDLSIALEMLLLSDNRNNDQLSLSFRLRGSWLLGTDSSSRRELYKQFRDLYNFRSQVAHSGTLCGDDFKKIEIVRNSFNDYASLAEQVAQKIIQNGPPDWTAILLGTT